MSKTSKAREVKGLLLESQILLRQAVTNLQEDPGYLESLDYQGKLEKAIALLKNSVGEPVERKPSWRDNKDILVFEIPARKPYRKAIQSS